MLWVSLNGKPADRIMLTRGEKPVGELTSFALKKSVKKSKHLLRNLNAWSVDIQVLRLAEAFGCEVVLVHESEENKDYKVRLSEFFGNGVKVDYGFGEQLALPLSYWN